ncbi:hypothetical protein Trydic_g2788 [Trypoxylus dichotomus]
MKGSGSSELKQHGTTVDPFSLEQTTAGTSGILNPHASLVELCQRKSMNLTDQDLSDLTIFRCRLCTRRLQVPIMGVGVFGNICGSCYQKSPCTEVVENVELDRLMAKLWFPCNYSEEGCMFYGTFYTACEHEKRCCFKRRACPFTYQNKCESETCYNLTEIVDHVNEQHPDDVVIPEDGNLTIRNPSEETPDLLYFIDFDDSYFLLRAVLKKSDCIVVYSFIHLLNNTSPKTIKFSSVAFSSTTKKTFEVNEFDWLQNNIENIFTVDLNVLKRLNFKEEIKISISIENVSTTKQACVARPLREGLAWWKCRLCRKIANQAYVCSCERLYSCGCLDKCSKCKRELILIDFLEVGIKHKFACEYKQCHKLIRGDKYDIHSNYQCLVKYHTCLFCRLRFEVPEMIAHLLETHKTKVNQRMCSMDLNSTANFIFHNYTDTFIQRYSLSAAGQFSLETIKLTEPQWDRSYVWRVVIKREHDNLVTSIAGDCSMDCNSGNLDVTFYMEDQKLTFYPFVGEKLLIS